VISRIEKRIPAMAAARGALKLTAVKVASGCIASSWWERIVGESFVGAGRRR
jgi:hypothetical protein